MRHIPFSSSRPHPRPFSLSLWTTLFIVATVLVSTITPSLDFTYSFSLRTSVHFLFYAANIAITIRSQRARKTRPASERIKFFASFIPKIQRQRDFSIYCGLPSTPRARFLPYLTICLWQVPSRVCWNRTRTRIRHPNRQKGEIAYRRRPEILTANTMTNVCKRKQKLIILISLRVNGCFLRARRNLIGMYDDVKSLLYVRTTWKDIDSWSFYPISNGKFLVLLFLIYYGLRRPAIRGKGIIYYLCYRLFSIVRIALNNEKKLNRAERQSNLKVEENHQIMGWWTSKSKPAKKIIQKGIVFLHRRATKKFTNLITFQRNQCGNKMQIPSTILFTKY